jgi:hypothetical protein
VESVDRPEPRVTQRSHRSANLQQVLEDIDALVDLIVHAPMRRPVAHAVGERRYWLTLWLQDGTSYADTGELMGGLVVPPEFRAILERYLAE